MTGFQTCLRAVFILFMLALCLPVSAQFVWDAGGGNANYANNPNWLPNGAPATESSHAYVFDIANLVAEPSYAEFWRPNNNIDNLTFTGLTIAGSDASWEGIWSGGWDIRGREIILAGDITASGGTHRYSMAATLTTDVGIHVADQSLQITVSLTGADHTVTKTGEGMLIISGANTLAGLVVDAGILRSTLGGTTTLGGPDALLTFNGGEFDLVQNAAQTFGQNVVVGGDFTLTHNRNNDGNGTAQTFGSLSIGDHVLTSRQGTDSIFATASTFAFGSTTLSGNAVFETLAGEGDLGANMSLGAVSETGGTRTLTKTGGGALSLTETGTYTGGSFINAGSIRAGADNALGTGLLTLQDGVTVSTVLNSNVRITLDNDVQINGDLNIGAAGFGAPLTFTGGVDLGSEIRTLNSFNVNPGNNNLRHILSGVVTGTGGLRLTGDGLLELSGNNEFSGGVTLVSGTLFLGNNAALGPGTLIIEGGTLRLTGIQNRNLANDIQVEGDFTIGAYGSFFILRGTMDLGGETRTLTFDGSGVKNLNGVISNGGLILDASTSEAVIMIRNNSYAGETTLLGGALQVGAAGGGMTGTGAVTVQTGGILLGTGTVRGYSFTAQAGATVHTGDGQTALDFGTLTISPVSGAGTLDFQADSVVYLGINPGGTSDLLNIVGTGQTELLFNNDLIVTAPDDFVPTAPEVFNLLDWTGLASDPTFAAHFTFVELLNGNGDEAPGLDLPDISGSGFIWDISQFTTNGSIAIVVIPEPSRLLLGALGFGSLLLRRRRAGGAC